MNQIKFSRPEVGPEGLRLTEELGKKGEMLLLNVDCEGIAELGTIHSLLQDVPRRPRELEPKWEERLGQATHHQGQQGFPHLVASRGYGLLSLLTP